MGDNIMEQKIEMNILEFKNYCKNKKFSKFFLGTNNQYNCVKDDMITMHCTFRKIRVDFNPNTITLLDFCVDPRSKDLKYTNYITFNGVCGVDIIKTEEGFMIFKIKCEDFRDRKQIRDFVILVS